MKMEVLERGETVVWIRLEVRLDLKGVEEIELAITVRAWKTARPVVVDSDSLLGMAAHRLRLSVAKEGWDTCRAEVERGARRARDTCRRARRRRAPGGGPGLCRARVKRKSPRRDPRRGLEGLRDRRA